MSLYFLSGQRYIDGEEPTSDVTFSNWTVDSYHEYLNIRDNENTSFAVFQSLIITPTVSWAQKDVDINFGQPIHIR